MFYPSMFYMQTYPPSHAPSVSNAPHGARHTLALSELRDLMVIEEDFNIPQDFMVAEMRPLRRATSLSVLE